MTDELRRQWSTTRLALTFAAGCAALAALAAMLRLKGAINDLWLDEILAVNLAGQVSSPLGVLTHLHHEINHHLYTLYLSLLGPEEGALVCRLPSLVAGFGTVVLAGLIGRRRGKAEAIFAMLVIGTSYVLVLYSGEARGYALAVFFAFLCFWLLERHLRSGGCWPAMLFSLGAILGFLSQITFLNFYLAALAWSSTRLTRANLPSKQIIRRLLCCHALPLAFLAVFYYVDLRHLTNLGGTTSPSVLRSYGASLAWAVGSPAAPGLQLLGAVLALGILAGGILWLWRQKSDAWVFFAGVVLVFPILLVLVRGSMVIYVRYFVVGIAFLLLLGGFLLAALWRRSWQGKLLCLLLLLAYLPANAWQIGRLFQYGRGHYQEAIRFMSQNSAEPLVVIASDQDFRTSTLLQFYAPAAMLPKQGRYVLRGEWPPQGPEWLICQQESSEKPAPPAVELKDSRENRYDLAKTFPAAPLSGLHWFLYHNRTNEVVQIRPALPSL
jgi:hypothetical protein